MVEFQVRYCLNTGNGRIDLILAGNVTTHAITTLPCQRFHRQTPTVPPKEMVGEEQSHGSHLWRGRTCASGLAGQ